MKPRFRDYVREAFNARPFGMFVAPNWMGIAAVGFLGVLNPGFWLLGAGLELGYLFVLLQNPRFRKYVETLHSGEALRAWQSEVARRVSELSPEDGSRFRALEERCNSVMATQKKTQAGSELRLQSEGLGRLLWIFHGLLQTRQTLHQLIDGVSDNAEAKIQRIDAQLAGETDENVRKSLSGQLEILKQRAATHREARAKLDFVEAELTRIEEQVELIREQSLLTADPGLLSRRIDEVGSTLTETTSWMREQQRLFGDASSILEETPALPLRQ